MDASSFRTHSVAHLWCVVQRFPRLHLLQVGQAGAGSREVNVVAAVAVIVNHAATLLVVRALRVCLRTRYAVDGAVRCTLL
ncbi:hypothetical protein GW15_0222235 [Xanthomonas axonopodis pv. vasculorum]|uniref:Uncharacterized protein n=1 Tax=Xanthomonas axonopodis pv. vasculorum TaxID=325777 RepID=A0A098PT62_9XANT|nr:hypothetical protein GW15_0222235 [Xanthomonas axonopodis pv. vasculorum]